MTTLQHARKELEACELELTELLRCGISGATAADALRRFDNALSSYRWALRQRFNA